MVGQRSTVLAAATVFVTTFAACGSGAEVASRAEPVTLEHGLRNLTPDIELPRYHAFVIAPTGEDVLVVGSRTDRAQGSVSAYRYDEARHKLTKLAPPPFSPAAESMSGVWTGKELVVVAWLCSYPNAPGDDQPYCSPGSLAATSYDPNHNTWTELPRPAAPTSGLALGWSGREAVFSLDTHIHAFDPSTRSWREIPLPPGAPHAGARVCMTSRGLVASWASTFAFLPNGATIWEPIQTPPTANGVNQAGFSNPMCGDTSLLFTNGGLDAVWLYELDGRQWRPMPNPPIEAYDRTYGSGAKIPLILDYRAWTGREYLLAKIGRTDSPALALDPNTATWRRVEPGPERVTFDPNLAATAWRDGTVFGASPSIWSWTPSDFEADAAPVPNQ